MINLQQRSYQPELMDGEDISFAAMAQTLKELNIINTRLGGHAITIKGVKKISAGISPLTICEIGCGSANILKHHPGIATKYTGLDFSEKLLNENSAKFPNARFTPIETANYFPEEDERFDLVFSVFCLDGVLHCNWFVLKQKD